MRADEELCRKALDSLLKEYGDDPEWTKGKEPPDYFLNFRGRRFAVEITSIHGETDLNGRRHSWIELDKNLLSFGADVCEKIKSEVRVHSCYLIGFPSIPDLKNQQNEIVRILTLFFHKEACKGDWMSAHVVLQSKGREISVWKLSEKESGLVAAALPTGAFITNGEDQLQETPDRCGSEKIG